MPDVIRAAHVIPSLEPLASGPSYSVPRLCNELAAMGLLVELHILAPGPADRGRYDTFAYSPRFGPASFGWSWAMARAMPQVVRRSHILHNHSLWMAPNVLSGLAIQLRAGCRLVCSPRGTLMPAALQRRPVVKRLLWATAQRYAVTRAALLHATSEAEAEAIRAHGHTQPIAVIPNGVELPPLRSRTPADARTVLFLGRLHPIKNLDVLLHAWRVVEPSIPRARLVIAGPGDTNYVGRLTDLASALALRRVTFLGPVFGSAKAHLLRESDILVLPSQSENFGMVVAEALAHEVPVIVSRGAPWATVAERGCGWWVEPAPDALATALADALRLPVDRLHKMGTCGRQWMNAEFNWPRVASLMRDAYAWLLFGGATPAHVHTL